MDLMLRRAQAPEHSSKAITGICAGQVLREQQSDEIRVQGARRKKGVL